eukprot:Em0018g474a
MNCFTLNGLFSIVSSNSVRNSTPRFIVASSACISTDREGVETLEIAEVVAVEGKGQADHPLALRILSGLRLRLSPLSSYDEVKDFAHFQRVHFPSLNAVAEK